MRVLIVDDEENIRWSLERALTHEGFSVSGASNVAGAQSILEAQDVDVVVTDLRMPGGDGFDLLRWARTNRPDVRMIMATAYGSTEVKSAAVRHGALHFLEKPVNISMLSELLKDMGERQGFDASLRNVSLFDLLQLLTLARGTRCIEVGRGKDIGQLTFRTGELVNARTGDLEGEPAFNKIMSWQAGDFREIPMPAESVRNVNLSTQELLFEAARLLDEANRNQSAAPPPTVPPNSLPSSAKPQEKPAMLAAAPILEKTPPPPNPGGVNVDNAVEIAPGVFWVGHRNPRSLLQINVYLRVFKGANTSVNLLIDPGSPVDLPVISKKVGQVIGDMGKVHLFSVNHQDPDVVANSVFIQRMNPRALCIATEDTWRLIQHFELDPARVKLVDKFKDGQMRLQTGQVVRFLLTPYCHFRGAVALYDVENRVLFTGDLFGGLSPSQHRGLFATEASWEGMKIFHQIYMPSNKVLRHAVAAIRRLDPPPLMIAPQHGDIIRGAELEEFLNRIAELPVGADLFEESETSQQTTLLRDAANELLAFATTLLGEEMVLSKLGVPGSRSRIAALAQLTGNSVTTVYRASGDLLGIIEKALSLDEPIEVVNQLRMSAIKVAVQRNLPVHTGKLEENESFFDEPEEELVQ